MAAIWAREQELEAGCRSGRAKGRSPAQHGKPPLFWEGLASPRGSLPPGPQSSFTPGEVVEVVALEEGAAGIQAREMSEEEGRASPQAAG